MAYKGGKVDASGEKINSIRIVTDQDADTGIGGVLDPMRVDPTGTTVQPVSISGGSVTISGSTTVTENGAPNAASGQVSVSNSATAIVSSRGTRRGVLIINQGGSDVYLGFTNGVTTSTGILLTGIKGTSIALPVTMGVWGIVSSGSQAISYVEVYD